MRTKIEMELFFHFILSGIYWQSSRPDKNKFDILNGRCKRVIPNGFHRNARACLGVASCALAPGVLKPAPAFAAPVLPSFIRGTGQ